MTTEYQPFASIVEISTGVNDEIDFTEGGVPATAAITKGFYYLYGNGAVSDDLNKAIADAMTLISPGALTYSSSVAFNVFESVKPSSTFITTAAGITNIQILSTGTFDLEIIGHPAGSPTATGTGITSTISCSRSWVSNQPSSVGFDAGPFERNTFEHATPDGTTYHFSAGDNFEFRGVGHQYVQDQRTFASYLNENYSFEEFWKIANDGRKIRVFQQVASTVSGAIPFLGSSALVGEYTLTGDSLTRFNPQRVQPGLAAFGWSISLRKVLP